MFNFIRDIRIINEQTKISAELANKIQASDEKLVVLAEEVRECAEKTAALKQKISKLEAEIKRTNPLKS